MEKREKEREEREESEKREKNCEIAPRALPFWLDLQCKTAILALVEQG